MSFLGHDSRDVCSGKGTGTYEDVQPTGIALGEQWIHLQGLCQSRETCQKNNLEAGFPSRKNTFPSCRRAQERITSRHMDNKPMSELCSVGFLHVPKCRRHQRAGKQGNLPYLFGNNQPNPIIWSPSVSYPLPVWESRGGQRGSVQFLLL